MRLASSDESFRYSFSAATPIGLHRSVMVALTFVSVLCVGCSEHSADLVQPTTTETSLRPAAKPARTVIPGEPLTVPAGVFCEFGIAGEPDENARRAVTVFSDGRTQVIGHGEPTLTNLESGASAVVVSRYRFTDTFNPELNELVTNFSGRFFLALLAGDQGPFGEVGENGGLFIFVGHFTATLDLDADIVTSFTWSGHIDDLCAVLSS